MVEMVGLGKDRRGLGEGRRGWFGRGAREGGQTGGLGDAFIGDHVSNFEGRLTVCKTEYLFI